MKKNMVVISIVAVLSVSQVAPMKLVRSHGTSSQNEAIRNASKVGIKFNNDEIKKIILAAKQNAQVRAMNGEGISLISPAHAMVTELKKVLETKKTSQNFFSRMYNKVVQNKGKIAAGVAAAGILAGAAYYFYNNPASTVTSVVTEAITPVAEAVKRNIQNIESSLLNSTKSMVEGICKVGFKQTGPRIIDWAANFTSGCKGMGLSNYGTDGLDCTAYKVIENGKTVFKYVGQCFNLKAY